MKHIGIRVWGSPSINELLYFDEIAILFNDVSDVFGIVLTPEDRNRIDFLMRKGVLINHHSALQAPEIANILADKFRTVRERFKKAMISFVLHIPIMRPRKMHPIHV